jgi:hypothetical protein
MSREHADGSGPTTDERVWDGLDRSRGVVRYFLAEKGVTGKWWPGMNGKGREY